MQRHVFLLACLLAGAPALATPPSTKAAARPPPCQSEAPERTIWPQGTLLWGTGRKVAGNEMSSVLASVDLARARRGSATLKGVRLEDGRLVAPSTGTKGLVGAVLQGKASDGQPVEVAICGADPTSQDPSMEWYRIEIWNAVSASWENPCIATGRVPSPRALAVRGVWDETGARREVPGKFTFACENGAIAKCVHWGYKPWAKKDGRPLTDLHQACTRMARADYCGDGRSHTREDNPIDMYDEFQVMTRATESSEVWDMKRASFEAAWTPEGASCLARTRDGRALETILAECPGRFEAGEKDLGDGDRCTMLRKSDSAKTELRKAGRAETVMLRNHSYGKGEQTPSKPATP
jgi:hypothetical protein